MATDDAGRRAVSERFRLELADRPCVNGLLINTLAAMADAEFRDAPGLVEIYARRAAFLRRLLDAFPV